MNESEFDFNDEMDLTSPECLQAINSLSPSFKPHWNAHQLLKYYEERELSEEQMRAMSEYLKEKDAIYLETHAEEAQKFLDDGNPPKCPSTKELIKRASKLFPELESLPWKKLYEQLEKSTGNKFEGVFEIKRDKVGTAIYCTRIESLWSILVQFDDNHEQVLNFIEKLIIKKLGVKTSWWKRIFG